MICKGEEKGSITDLISRQRPTDGGEVQGSITDLKSWPANDLPKEKNKVVLQTSNPADCALKLS